MAAKRNPVLNETIPSDLVASFRDPARLCPVLSGAAWLNGKSLVVRTASNDVEVSASKSLLAQVYALCDGTRTIDEVVAQAAPVHAGEIGDFVHFLLQEGALIDANLLTTQAAMYAFQGSPFGLVAPSRVSNQLCRRFLWNAAGAYSTQPRGARRVSQVPMSDLFAARVSTYTFDDQPVAEQALLKMAWSIAGVVRTRHERVGYVTPKRTIASAGGMHLVQVFVALRRAVDTYKAGVYRVLYPSEKTVALEWVGANQGMIPRAFSKPWELSVATGAFFLMADAQAAAMRYRNRAVQYLFMEAGAALHNAGLTAPQLGLGFATIGGYYENIVQRMCDLENRLVLGAGIFGPKPKQRQLKDANRALDLEFTWVNGNSDRYSMPFHLASARVRTPGDDRPHTWGRDVDPWIAYRKAAAEAVEREGFREPKGLFTGRLHELAGAVDPRDVIQYTDEQLANADFPFAPFDAKREHCWVGATNLRSGERVCVLAELVYSQAAIAAQGYRTGKPVTQVTSSGCAAGVSVNDATLRALLEVVERDAFMRHWLAQRPGEAVSHEVLPAGIAERIRSLGRAGCRVSVQRLNSPWAHVCLVAAQNADLHFTTMGTAAASNFNHALKSALEETEARVYAWIHGHKPEIDTPELVATPEHHFELYGSKRFFRRADAVLFPSKSDGAVPAPLRIRDQAQLVRRMAGGGLHPVVVDITPANASIDQGRSQLFVVKALVPGLLPVSFGFRREPLGMVPRAHSAAKFPHPFP